MRFGGEKAIAVLAGKPLLLWAAQRLEGSCAEVAVNTRPGTEAEALAKASGYTVLHDAPGDPDGPLAGVKAGLRWAQSKRARSLAVSPCDAPLLPPDLFERLLAAAGERAAMAETSEGRQPLCAVWPVTALEVVERALDGGDHPPTWRLLEEVGVIRVRFDQAGSFANLNTRADLEALAPRFTSDTDRR